MRNVILFAITFSILFFVSGCNTAGEDQIKIGEEEPIPTIDYETFQQDWVHSQEEDPEDNYHIDIFRPSNYKEYPPSRFRMEYHFKEDSVLEWLYLSPIDAHHFKTGKWWIEYEENPLLKAEMDSLISTFEILELNDSTLVLEKI